MLCKKVEEMFSVVGFTGSLVKLHRALFHIDISDWFVMASLISNYLF